MTDKEVMQSAMNEHCPACGYYCLGNGGVYCIDKPTTVETTRACLAQPEPEPVAWRFYDGNMWCYVDHLTNLPQDKFEPLYTEPPKKEWVDLTDEQILIIEETTTCTGNESWLRKLARNIEAKSKELNHEQTN